ncbi:MAG: triple tyrosine motif-containing protein [Halioglobus sp.]
MGTQQGLYRFDGDGLLAFDSRGASASQIPASDITGIAETNSGAIFVSTFGGGLLKWNQFSKSFEVTSFGQPSNERFLTHLYATRSGDIWIGTKNGIFFYDNQISQKTTWIENHPLTGIIGQPISIDEDAKGNIFIASNSGIYKISEKHKAIERLDFGASDIAGDAKITAMTLDQDGHMFLGTSDGNVLLLDTGTGLVISKSKIEKNTSSSILELITHQGRLWIGTNNGLTAANVDLSRIEFFEQSNSELSNNHITLIYKDNRSIWIGTYQGLNVISFVPFTTFNKKNSGVFNDVMAFSQDSSEQVWVGTYNGLYRFDEKKRSHIKTGERFDEPAILDQRIMTLATKGDEVWLGFRRGGVQVINAPRKKRPAIQNSSELEVTKILHLINGETWVGTHNQGLFRLQGDLADSFLLNNELPESSISTLFQRASGALLIGTENGIYEYTGRSQQFHHIQFQFEGLEQHPLVLSINQDSNGGLWFGTKDQGLYIWTKSHQLSDDTNLKRAGMVDSESSTTIYGIEFDLSGQIWCSTQDGLLKLDVSGNILARFGQADGLQGNDFNFGASFRDNQGRIYFGGTNGYNRFTPEQVTVDLTPPRVLLTNLELSESTNSQLFDPTILKTLQLTHKDYFVIFTFSVLDFLDPEKNQFRYMLENFDPDWIDNGTRNTARYTNLPAGDYVFRVQGANSAGIWNREGISLTVRVLPPPWLSWWAYCVYAGVCMIFLWIFKRVYDSYAIKNKATELAIAMNASQNRADDEMQEQLESQDDLVQSVYKHNVATLKLLSAYISRQHNYLSDDNSLESNVANLRMVSALTTLEDCLYYQNDGLLADLHKYVDILISMLVKDATVPPETITTINEVPANLLPAELASPLSIALYELLENCFLHAFESASPANYVHVTLTTQESPVRCLVLRVQDNGVGCPGNIGLDAPDTPGFITLLAIAEQLSGSISISTDGGTRITLKLPYAMPEQNIASRSAPP